MKKILITSMVAASMMFVGCGSSSSSTPKEEAPLPVVNDDVNKTEDNATIIEDVNKTIEAEVIVGTTVIGTVRFANIDASSIKTSHSDAVQYCEALDGDNSWTLPTKDQLLLLLSGDDNSINETVIPKLTPDSDKPEETTHTSAIWSSTISINVDNNTSDPDLRDVLFLGTKEIITQNITDTVNPGDYYTVCVKDVKITN